MLKELHIKNFAIAESISIDFGKGLNLITGETGAGKSIIINALMAILGERTSPDVIRTDQENAIITGIFNLRKNENVKSLFFDLGIEDTDEIVIRRIISRNGKSRAFINDIPVNISTLKQLGDFLVDIHGQHEHQFLLNESHHLPYLDIYLNDPTLLQQVAAQFMDFKNARQELKKLSELQSELLQKKDFLEFQLNELKEADLKEGELEELESQRNTLIHSEKIAVACNKINHIVEEADSNLNALIRELRQSVNILSEFSDLFKDYSEQLEESMILFNEISRDAADFLNSLEYSPQIQDKIESRISKIKRLMKKYNKDVPELIETLKDLDTQLQTLNNFDVELEAAERKLELIRKEYLVFAKSLHDSREKSGKLLSEQVEKELRELGMPHARFVVEVNKLDEQPENFLKTGLDSVRFLFSSNPGEDLKPLSKIASGGEISRLMLALKKVFAEKDQVPTLIFDEIDTGVSGETALAVGKKIKDLSKSHQLICITHLPQIAAQPGEHFFVQKEVRNDKTFTIINKLSEHSRIEEIARLIGGQYKDQTVLESARFLLNQQISGDR
ncbi:MAG: DNA repair protein RecN [Calditrichia bacterium]